MRTWNQKWTENPWRCYVFISLVYCIPPLSNKPCVFHPSCPRTPFTYKILHIVSSVVALCCFPCFHSANKQSHQTLNLVYSCGSKTLFVDLFSIRWCSILSNKLTRPILSVSKPRPTPQPTHIDAHAILAHCPTTMNCMTSCKEGYTLGGTDAHGCPSCTCAKIQKSKVSKLHVRLNIYLLGLTINKNSNEQANKMYFKLNVKRGVKSNRQPSQLKHVTQPSPAWRHVPTDTRWETKVTTAARPVGVNRSVPRARPIQSSCRRWMNATTVVLNPSRSSSFRRRRSVRTTAAITLV